MCDCSDGIANGQAPTQTGLPPMGKFTNLYVANSLTTTNVYATSIFGNLSYLVNNGHYFILNPDGSFIFPNNELSVGSNALTLKSQSSFGFTWDWNDGAGSLTDVNVNSGGVNFETATPSLTSRWYFNPDSSTVLPGNVSTTNAWISDTLQVNGSMTANVSNATFFFDTFTIPYINTQILNVASMVGTTNVSTLNVQTLYASSAVVYGSNTLNVLGISNLNSVTTSRANVGTLNVFQISNLNSLTTNLVASQANVGVLNVTTVSNLQSLTTNVTSTLANVVTLNVFQISNLNSLVLGNNLYAPNALTTTNLTTAGFTSNASNTVFNFDTFTIPFVNSTTLNVASTANISTATLTGTTGLVTLYTVGNIYASNAFSATNVLAATETLAGTTGRTTLAVTGNVYASNAVTTTNVISNYSTISGTSGSNVFLFSNSSGGSNVIIMDSSGRIGIANTAPAYLLDVGSVVNIPTGSGGETIRSKGPLIIGNGVNDGNRFISALDSSLAGGGARYITMGKAGSTYNQAEFAYVHSADGSVNNRLDFGFFSKTVMTLLASGSVGIGVNNPSSNLQIVGNVYASNSLSTTNVVATSVVPTYPLSFRNRIINGDFIIDQRNAGANTTPSTGLTRVTDRWKVEVAGTGRCIVGQNLNAIASPAGFTSYYGMQVSTTTTVNASDYFFLSQVIEGINMVDLVWGQATAKPVTLGFWVFSSITGTGGGFIRNAGETSGNYSRSFPFTYTINGANVWEYKTVAITGDTTGQWLSGQLDGVEVGFIMWNGTGFQGTPGVWGGANYTGPSGGTIGYAGSLNSRLFVTGVQLEAGPFATPFERRQLAFELAQCQRYYETSIARLGGYNTAGGTLRTSVYFNTKKRPKASPTLTNISTLESFNLGALTIDNSNFDQSSVRVLAGVTATGDAYGQWKVSVDCEF